jgi:glycosyltransferase involved in cell wall biosynthesis
MKKKIINITIAPDTVAIFLTDIIDYIELHGYETYTMANEEESLHTKYLKSNQKNFYTHGISRKLVFFRELKAMYKVYKFFKENKFDIIHLHTPKILLLFSIIIKLTKNGKVVGTYHGSLGKENKPIRNAIFYFIDYMNSFFIDYMFTVNNNDLKRFWKYRLYNKSNSSVVSLSGIGVKSRLFKVISLEEKQKIKEKLGIPLNAKVIGNISRFTKDKGIDVIKKTIKKLQNRYSHSFVFLHIGNIEDKKYFNSIKIENMMALGYKNQEELYLYYNIMDLFFFPSLREGFGISVAEANLCGVPALVSDIKGLNEVVVNNKNGFRVKKTEEYVEYLSHYLSNENELKSLKESTLKYAQERFNQSEASLNTFNVYESLIKIAESENV